MAGSRWLLRYDHQSTAWLVALPSVLDIRERDRFRVHLKLPFCGVRHHLLKGFDQNVASWNPRSTQNCQCCTTQHGCWKRDGRRSALPDLNKAGFRLHSYKFSSCYRCQKRLCRLAPHVIDHNLKSRLARFPDKCLAQFSLWQSEGNGRVGAQIVERVQCLSIATGSNDPSSPKKPRDLYRQLAGHARRPKDEDAFAAYQLCAVGQ